MATRVRASLDCATVVLKRNQDEIDLTLDSDEEETKPTFLPSSPLPIGRFSAEGRAEEPEEDDGRYSPMPPTPVMTFAATLSRRRRLEHSTATPPDLRAPVAPGPTPGVQSRVSSVCGTLML